MSASIQPHTTDASPAELAAIGERAAELDLSLPTDIETTPEAYALIHQWRDAMPETPAHMSDRDVLCLMSAVVEYLRNKDAEQQAAGGAA